MFDHVTSLEKANEYEFHFNRLVMARSNPGRLVKWTDKEGKPRYGIAYNAKQEKQFGERLAITEVSYPDFQPVLIDGKEATILKAVTELKLIGMVD